MIHSKNAFIGYWNARGLIQSIKFILDFLKIPYTVVVPKCGPAPFFDKEEFRQEKYELLKRYDFPNLLYFNTHLHNNGIYRYEKWITPQRRRIN